jgi:hypothetical protein
MTVMNLTEGLDSHEADIKESENTDSNEQSAATTRQGFIKMLVFYEEILKEKKRSLPCQILVPDFFNSSTGTLTSPPVL